MSVTLKNNTSLFASATSLYIGRKSNRPMAKIVISATVASKNAPPRAWTMLVSGAEIAGNKTRIGITAKSCISKIENDKRPTRVVSSPFSEIICSTIAVEESDKAPPIMIATSVEMSKK